MTALEPPPSRRCNLFWGSHGCDLEAGHDGYHTCDANDPDGVCSQYRGPVPPTGSSEPATGEVRFRLIEDDGRETWGEWMPGWRCFW